MVYSVSIEFLAATNFPKDLLNPPMAIVAGRVSIDRSVRGPVEHWLRSSQGNLKGGQWWHQGYLYKKMRLKTLQECQWTCGGDYWPFPAEHAKRKAGVSLWGVDGSFMCDALVLENIGDLGGKELSNLVDHWQAETIWKTFQNVIQLNPWRQILAFGLASRQMVLTSTLPSAQGFRRF